MTKVVVYHRGYGCETGCCGHAVTIGTITDPYMGAPEPDLKFEFGHPDSNSLADRRKYAERLVRQTMGEEHVKDLDWDHSFVYDEDAPNFPTDLPEM